MSTDQTARALRRFELPALATPVAYLELARFPQVLVVVAGTFIGSRIAGLGFGDLPRVAAVALSNALLFAASMALNDWHDVAEDSINKPLRPLPSGRLPRARALAVACLSFTLGVAVAAAVDWSLAACSAVVTLLSAAYTTRWKRIPLVGNMTVALLSTYPLWCWTATGARLSRLYLTLMVACFVFRLGAEVVKTAEDFSGDKACGILTLATTRGTEFANRFGATSMLLGLLLCWLAMRDARMVYTAGLSLATITAGVAWTRAFFVSDSSRRSSRILVGLGRFMMVVMVIALVLGEVRGPS